MDKYTATELAFKHGYEKGYEAGKRDAVKRDDCNKALERGFEEGKAAGFEKKILAYENEIECLKKQLDWAISKIKQLAEKN